MSFLISHPDVEGTAVIPEHTLTSYARNGWVLVDRTDAPAGDGEPPALDLPPRNATSAAWKTYAVVQGMPYDEAMSKTRDELADKFHPAEPKAAPAPAPKGRGRRNTPITPAPDPDPVVDTAAPAPAADTTQES